MDIRQVLLVTIIFQEMIVVFQQMGTMSLLLDLNLIIQLLISLAYLVLMELVHLGNMKTEELREKLIDFKSLIELELDFSEEDVEFADRKDLKDLLNTLESKLSGLIESFSYGNVIKEGVTVTIAGKPNAGKSSLLNALVNEDKAIVSDIPGTTRDAIEDVTVINGIKFRFIDTAGIRETSDKIESIGVERAKGKIGKSRVLIYLFDRSDISENCLLYTSPSPRDS